MEIDDDDSDNLYLAWERIKSSQVFAAPPTTTQRLAHSIRLVCMSDTHAQHEQVPLPAGDILIHAGDITKLGEPDSIESLSHYFETSAFSNIVCIAGNHDIGFHTEFYEANWQRFHRQKLSEPSRIRGCTYLQDSSCTIQGIPIYGSPWTPEFYDWAFNLPRGLPIRQVWDCIPLETDVLVTHGPPLGRGDRTPHSGRAGCADLLHVVQTVVRPRVHVFGHIHEDAGVTFDGRTLFVNAANVNQEYRVTKPCTVIDLPINPSLPGHLVRPICTLRRLDVRQRLQRQAKLVDYVREAEVWKLLSGNDLLQSNAFGYLCDLLHLHRDQEAQFALQQALLQVHAESFV